MNRFTCRIVASLVACIALAGVPAAAHAWAAGTHAYIAKHTEKKAGQIDANEMCNRIYGANATDLFNTDFTPTGQTLANAMHDRDRLLPLLPWSLAKTGWGERARAFAFGMASHNDTWGTDSIAHYAGITFGRDEGYVVAKAMILKDELAALLPPELGFTPDQLLLVAHVLVENGIDVLVAGVDPGVSGALMAATACWRPEGELPAQLQLLLASLVPALGQDVGYAEAAQEIVDALPGFMADMGGTGYVLGFPPDQAVDLFAGVAASRAEAVLGLPPGSLDPIRGELKAIAAYGIWRGMQLCAPDFMGELDATIGRVNGRMSAAGISP